MLAKSLLLVGLSLPAQIVALQLHESVGIPHGWTYVKDAAASQKVSLEIELNLSNMDKMIDTLYDVSTPGNAQYGKHWSREQVNALVKPSDEAIMATVGWLNASEVDAIATTWHSVRFSTTVAKANKLLNASFKVYEHSGVQKLRTTQYSVHEDVAQHVDLIHPATYFGTPKRNFIKPLVLPGNTAATPMAKGAPVDANCTRYLTPTCVRELYGVPLNYAPNNNAGASIAFGSFLGQSAQQSDLNLFTTHFGIKNQTMDIQTINGGVNVQNRSAANGEANLDAQNIVGISHPLPIREYITAGMPPYIPDLLSPAGDDTNEPYLEYYEYLLSQTNQDLPQVISNSYGDHENTVPIKYATRVCNLIAMMGARGISVLESSGDEGVGAVCQSSDGKKTPEFTPAFPGTCPYVTAIGGTQQIPEIAWVGSQGGFSKYFPRPAYQETAVNTYLNKHINATTAVYYSSNDYTNFSGRGFPDISAMSVSPYYYGVYNGRAALNGGTSAASPVVAGIIALINDYRLKHGRAALGFLNPYLYSSGYKALNDITGGQSIGCNGQNTQGGPPIVGGGIIPYATWNATKGWDPVTGFGTPDFSKMLKTWGKV